MHLDSSRLEFLARFSKAPESKALLEILRALLAEVDQKLRTATGEELFRTQGRAQQLDEFIEMVTKAEQKLNRTSRTVQRLPAGAHM